MSVRVYRIGIMTYTSYILYSTCTGSEKLTVCPTQIFVATAIQLHQTIQVHQVQRSSMPFRSR